MGLEEFMNEMMDIAIELDDNANTENEVFDNIDFTIRSVIYQMGWTDDVKIEVNW